MKIVATIVAILLLCAPALADVTIDVRFGHGLEVVAGAITPLVVTLTAGAGETEPIAVKLRTRPGSNLGAGEVYAADVLTPGTTKAITFLYRPYARTRPEVEIGFSRRVVVQLSDKRTELPVKAITVRAPAPSDRGGSQALSRYTVLTVGPGANVLPTPPDGLRFLPMEEKTLPDTWHAYDGIDAVLLRNPAEEKAIPPGKIDALLRYVEMGGRLVITTRRPDRLREMGLWEHLPADLGAPVIPDITTTELSVPFAPQIPKQMGDAPPQTKGPLYAMTPRDGAKVLATLPDLGLPLIAEKNHGYGSIVVVAFDTSRFRPLNQNRAICFYGVLFGGMSARGATSNVDLTEGWVFPASESFIGGTVDQTPVTDILKLLRAGALRPPPMGLLFLFMVLYIIAVGPLDYFILKRYKLLRWSALTFLGLAIVFSLSAWFVSFHLFAGAEKVNRVTFVDLLPGPDGGPDRLVIQDLAGYYAPTGARLEFDPRGETTHVSDFTDPDSYRGGGGLQRSPVELAFPSPTRVQASLLVPFRSLRTTRTLVERRVTVPLDVIVGEHEITVRNGLGCDLRDLQVIIDGAAVRFGTVDAGAEVTRPATLRSLSFQPLKGLNQFFSDEPTTADLLSVGARLYSLNWASAGSARLRGDPDWNEHFHSLAKFGIDRSPAILRNVGLVTAWTDARDPFGLPDADSDGFTLTFIRKVIRP